MNEPFIFISSSKIKEGGLEEYAAYVHEMVELIQAGEPRLIAFSTYVNEMDTKATTVQVHPDAESMLFHLHFMREKMDTAYNLLEIESVTFCGKMNDRLLDVANQIVENGIRLNVNPKTLAGFYRHAGG